MATGSAILTPGPMNDTYYEHAYIARYLGFMLLEGEDMVVQDGQVMVRTVAGLRPLSVLWRRLDAQFADPMELDGSLADRHARAFGRGQRRASCRWSMRWARACSRRAR